MAVKRLRSNNTAVKNITSKKDQFVEAFLNPKTYFLFLFGLLSQVVNGSTSNFDSLIIKRFGYSNLVTTLLRIPYGAIIIFAVLSAMHLQRGLAGHKRCVVAALYIIPDLAGVVALQALPTHYEKARLGCYYIRIMLYYDESKKLIK